MSERCGAYKYLYIHREWHEVMWLDGHKKKKSSCATVISGWTRMAY